MNGPIDAWHFVGDTLRDGRPIPADGEVLVHDGDIELCVSGLHASRDIMDALKYAAGSTICRVRCDGKMRESDDKLVCTRRAILWRVDAQQVLHDFARWCALQVIDYWDAPDVMREWLATGDPKLRSAAKSAAESVAEASTTSTARAAAGAAEAAATKSTARSTARSAARSAAWATAWSTAESLSTPLGSAAAVSVAASVAASAQSAKLAEMVLMLR